MTISTDQRFVLLGMGSGAAFSILFVVATFHLGVFEPPALGSLGERIAYVLRCEFWAAFALLAGVARVAAARFFSDEIDGTGEPRARALQVHRAYVSNTAEQLLLLFFAHLGLALVLPDRALGLIPILVTLFLVGRATFWAGYLRSPSARAFGFATTFYPTVAVFVHVALRLATS